MSQLEEQILKQNVLEEHRKVHELQLRIKELRADVERYVAINAQLLEDLEKAKPQLAKLRNQKPIWSGWSVWFKGGDGLFPAQFLHDSYGIPLRFPTRFDAAEKIKRHTKDSRELYEPREYSLYDAPQAPAVPAEWRKVLAELADDLAIEIDQNYPPESRMYPSEQRRYKGEMEIVNLARALLKSAGENS